MLHGAAGVGEKAGRDVAAAGAVGVGRLPVATLLPLSPLALAPAAACDVVAVVAVGGWPRCRWRRCCCVAPLALAMMPVAIVEAAVAAGVGAIAGCDVAAARAGRICGTARGNVVAVDAAGVGSSAGCDVGAVVAVGIGPCPVATLLLYRRRHWRCCRERCCCRRRWRWRFCLWRRWRCHRRWRRTVIPLATLLLADAAGDWTKSPYGGIVPASTPLALVAYADGGVAAVGAGRSWRRCQLRCCRCPSPLASAPAPQAVLLPMPPSSPAGLGRLRRRCCIRPLVPDPARAHRERGTESRVSVSAVALCFNTVRLRLRFPLRSGMRSNPGARR